MKESLEAFLERQIQAGREAEFNRSMVAYEICINRVKVALDEYHVLLPLQKEDLFVKEFAPVSREGRYFWRSTRTKSFRAVYEKIYDGDLKEEEIFEMVRDLAGGRVVCIYLSQVEFLMENLVEGYLQNTLGWRVRWDAMKNWIDDCKRDGYRSINMLLDIPIKSYGVEATVCFELQLRSALQDTWATRAHPLVYKNRDLKDACKESTEQISNMLVALSESLHEVDIAFDDVRKLVIQTTSPSSEAA